ncbi:serine hydrolase domain-containing protein [Dactylosporangium sucinum]|uniref:Beta-lactamase-related domain-containing protein n=1 Tax=Dactylosporangium sucinum TaxID=1424081 RepID=A0A917UBI2_9ACTN|nr:serine hydrolase domain-containing protein [Dactylosporangium sucinum]GGM69027.1 hypothetical protein GCM10007977_083400 [Dactylosporangium sucinum]
MRRRAVLGLLGALLTGCSAPRVAASSLDPWTVPVSTPSPWAPPTGRYEASLRSALQRYRDLFPGAVLFAAVDGHVAAHFAVGDAVRSGGDPVPATTGTIYDLASLTKVFTAILVLRLYEQGTVQLDAPAARYVPLFGNKPDITVRMLLTHTSGLSKDTPLVGDTPADRLDHVLREPPVAAPGSGYRYADQNFIALGALAERLGGEPLDRQVRRQIAAPLGLADTGYRPPAALLPRIAATEGALRGRVHDPSAAAFGGVAGHAGLFSTAADVALLGRALLAGGGPLLRPPTVELMRTNQNPAFGPSAAHGLGVDLDQAWYMGRLAGHGAFGHTGFTGTSIVVEPRRRVVLVLLTNRVHLGASPPSTNPARKAVADALAA